MTEILKDRNCRIIAVIGLYLLYETVNEIIDSDYNLKATYDDKSIVLQNNLFYHLKQTTPSMNKMLRFEHLF